MIAKPALILLSRPKLITPFDEGFYDELQEAIRPSLKHKLKPFRSAGSTIAFVASAGSTAATITIPAGASAGQFAILFDFAANVNGGGIPTQTIPTNWTGIPAGSGSLDAGAADLRFQVSRRTLVGGEPGSSITGMTGTQSIAKVMLVFSCTPAYSTVTEGDWINEFSTTDPASQTCNASGGGTPLIVFGCAASTATGGAAAFTTASPAFDATVADGGATTRCLVGYKIYNSSPADHTIDMADLGTNSLSSGYITLT